MNRRCSLFYLVLNSKELHSDNTVAGSRRIWGGRRPLLFSWNYFIRVAAYVGCHFVQFWLVNHEGGELLPWSLGFLLELQRPDFLGDYSLTLITLRKYTYIPLVLGCTQMAEKNDLIHFQAMVKQSTWYKTHYFPLLGSLILRLLQCWAETDKLHNHF